MYIPWQSTLMQETFGASSTDASIVGTMSDKVISFYSSVVAELWPLFLSIGVLAFAAGFILRKLSFGRK
jgi:hypothetical protein